MNVERWRLAILAAAALIALVAAGCLGGTGGSGADGDGDDRNLYETAVVTQIEAVDAGRSVAAEVTLRAGAFCPDTERRRFEVSAAWVGDDAVLGRSRNATVVPREGNATVRLTVPPHADVRRLRLVRVRAYRNGTRTEPACPEIVDVGDGPTATTRFVANVTGGGFGDVEQAGPPDRSLAH